MVTKILRIISQPFFLIIAFTLMFLLRAIYLDSDPSFLMEGAFLTDEGWWAHNARNAALFGTWKMDDFNVSLYLTPLFSIFEYFIFKIIGVSLISVRLLSVTTGFLTVIIFYFLLRQVWDVEKSALAALFFGFSNFHIMHSRVALVEATLVMFLILTLYLWKRGQHNKIWCFLSGLSFGLTFLVKLTAIYFVPIFLSLWAVEYIRKEFNKSSFVYFTLGSFVVGLPYLIFFVIPNWYEWKHMLDAGSPNVFNPIYIAKFLFNNIFILMPVLSSMVIVYFICFSSEMIRNWRNTIQNIDYAEVLSLSIFIGNAGFLAISSVQPDRRYLPFLFSLAIFGARVLSDPQKYFGSKRFEGKSGTLLLLIVLSPLWIYIVYVFLIVGKTISVGNLAYPSIYIHDIFKMIFHFLKLNMMTESGAKYLLIFLGFLIALCGLFIIIWKRQQPHLLDRKNIIYAVILLFFLFQMGQYGTWLINPTFTIREAAIEIGNYVGTKPIVLKGSTIAVDSKAPLIVVHWKGINANVFSRFKAKFALTALVDDGQHVNPDFVIFRTKKRDNEEKLPYGSTLIKKFYLCPFRDSYRYVFCLWQLPP